MGRPVRILLPIRIQVSWGHPQKASPLPGSPGTHLKKLLMAQGQPQIHLKHEGENPSCIPLCDEGRGATSVWPHIRWRGTRAPGGGAGGRLQALCRVVAMPTAPDPARNTQPGCRGGNGDAVFSEADNDLSESRDQCRCLGNAAQEQTAPKSIPEAAAPSSHQAGAEEQLSILVGLDLPSGLRHLAAAPRPLHPQTCSCQPRATPVAPQRHPAPRKHRALLGQLLSSGHTPFHSRRAWRALPG